MMEILSSMLTRNSFLSGGTLFRLALLSVSAITCYLPGRYSTFRSYPFNFSIIVWSRRGAENNGLRKIVSKGLWSVYTLVSFPTIYSLNFVVLNTIASIFFSLGDQFDSDARRFRDA